MIVFWISVLPFLLIGAHAQQYKICTTKERSAECEQFRDKLGCITRESAVDCALAVQYGQADFFPASANEAHLIGSQLTELTVLGEIRPNDRLQNATDFDVIVLTDKDFNNANGFQGKKLCHPGFEMDAVPPLMIREIESKILKLNQTTVCQSRDTMEEVRTRELHNLLGSSCRPGRWTVDDDLENKLKSTYANLTSLCTDKDGGDFQKAFNCLYTRKGDFAITTAGTVQSLTTPLQRQEYRLLCKDLSLAVYDIGCTWSQQPWSVIIGNRDNAGELRSILKEYLGDYVFIPAQPFNTRATTTNKLLIEILFKHYPNHKLVIDENLLPTVNKFISDFRSVPNLVESRAHCNMTLCTVSEEEQKKCEWFAQASANAGIEPTIACIQAEDKLDCMRRIQDGTSDVTVIDEDFYIAFKRNLVPIAYPVTNEDTIQKYVLVLKSSDESIKKFSDLKGKKACFSSYGSNAMMALGNLLYTKKLLGVNYQFNCNYGEAFVDFFSQSCIPGANDWHYRNIKLNDVQIQKACDMCQANIEATARTCNTNEQNDYYGNIGALKCLQETGDVAIISLKNLTGVNLSEFKVLCRDEKISALPSVSNECALAALTNSIVVASKNNTNLNDVKLAFEEIDARLSYKAFFNPFKPFNQTKGLLFMDKTTGLETEKSTNPFIQNNVNLFKTADECKVPESTSSATALSNFPIMIIVLFIVLAFTPVHPG